LSGEPGQIEGFGIATVCKEEFVEHASIVSGKSSPRTYGALLSQGALVWRQRARGGRPVRGT
jgi:hypothetical protein